MLTVILLFLRILMAEADCPEFDPLPCEFDLRTKFPECPSVSSPLNQGSCGSCWAFSTTSTTADRLCMWGWTTEFMAPEHPVQCDTGQDGCDGGYIRTAFDFQKSNGLVPLVCKAYRDTQARRCASTCDDQTPITPNMLLKPSARTDKIKDRQLVRQELYTQGSVTGSFKVFEEFYDYFNKNKSIHYVVSAQPGAFETYHAVKIIGWTKEGWLIQNSWGKGWADGGYFRIKYGEGEIDNDIYAPIVPEYIDPCVANNGFTCGECNNVTQTENGVETVTACKYCLTTDKCIQITNKGEPAHGICQKFAEGADQCPIDDCEQMSGDPLRCLSHRGCGYCVSTKKCRKGLDRPNTGECQNWFKELGAFTTQYNGTRYKTADKCTENNAMWCEGIEKCLDKIPSLNSTQVGRCKGEAKGNGSKGETMYTKTCDDYTNKATCEKNTTCKWNIVTKRCNAKSASSDAKGKGQERSKGRFSNAGIKTDAECLRYKCRTCNNAEGCVWCLTTQSCIADSTQVDLTTGKIITAETNCTQIINSSSEEDPCSECIGYSSCTSCAKDPTCGWWDTSSYCSEGRKTQKNYPNKPQENDKFLSYKTQCEIVAGDELEPYDASLNYQNGGAGGSAARIARVPQVATYLLAGVASLVALLIMV